MSKPVILTGIRANGELHLGNYLGAILPVIELQQKHSHEYQINMFIPDLHSFTTPIDHGTLYRQTLDNIKLFVAAGLDIHQPQTYIYRQSHIPAHSELTWILSCFTYFGELRRMTQFKDRAKSHAVDGKQVIDGDDTEEPVEQLVHHLTAGLFIYPVLMAADILLYGAKWVPVGEDQRQHLELTRDIAERMNTKFGDIFTVPETWAKQLAFAGRKNGVRIRSLKNPAKKMSKSVSDPAGTILLSDSPEAAAKKIMGATTDSVGSIHYDWDKQPGVSNLLQILSLLSRQPLNDIVKEWDDRPNYGELKKAVAVEVHKFLTNLQLSIKDTDDASVISKLEQNEIEMQKVAAATLLKLQKGLGLRSA